MRALSLSRIRQLLLAVMLGVLIGLPACGDDAPKAATETAPEAGATTLGPSEPHRSGSETQAPGETTGAAPSTPAPASKPGQTERWYVQTRAGASVGYQQVVWSPSTWQGKPTIHDTTTFVSRSVRDMGGHRDVFESTTTYDIERSEDGMLWSLKIVVEEGGRVIREETTWNGHGYDNVARIQGQPEQRKTVAADQPVPIDAESLLGHLHRKGELAVGQKHALRQINMAAERVDISDLVVVAAEQVKDEHGDLIDALRILETNPRTKTEATMWLDAQGAFVKIRAEGGVVVTRVTAAQARKRPSSVNVMRITTPSRPPLERVFSADQHIVEVHLQADPDRKLPEFPDSPWSRVLSKRGSDAAGWVFTVELNKYDSEEKTATLPVTDAVFADELKSTLLMQTTDRRVQATAKGAIGTEKDVRKAAYLLARFVTETLSKRSPDVGQAAALEILDDRCGDCSEHCLLFVTLCRAVGIPARRCSGYVNIGSMWGAHAWCEIWTGQWIAADPTTGEVGGGARYFFFGYSDKPDSHPGVISGRVQGRMRFVSQTLMEGAATLDLSEPATWRRYDQENGRYLHVLAGLEARDVPSTWRVTLSGDGSMRIRAGSMHAVLTARAAQHQTYESVRRRLIPGVERVTYATAPAILQSRGTSSRRYTIWSRRRILNLSVTGGDADARAMLEKVLAPTFQAAPLAWDSKK